MNTNYMAAVARLLGTESSQERKEYMADMDIEERCVREQIAVIKDKIGRSKRNITRANKFLADIGRPDKDICRKSLDSCIIKTSKHIIKALKKHLPQYLYLVEDDPYYQGWRCPTCHYRVLRTCEEMDFTRSYCPSCGQKLLGKNPAY